MYLQVCIGPRRSLNQMVAMDAGGNDRPVETSTHELQSARRAREWMSAMWKSSPVGPSQSHPKVVEYDISSVHGTEYDGNLTERTHLA
jgi:hypothetical protein